MERHSIDDLVREVGGMRITTGGQAAAPEPLFAMQPQSESMSAAEVVALLVARFGASECYTLRNDRGYHAHRGSRAPSAAGLAMYLRDHMWLERTRPPHTPIHSAAAPHFERVIGLSPQGMAAVLCSDGRARYLDLADHLADEPFLREWSVHPVFQAPSKEEAELRVANIDRTMASLHYVRTDGGAHEVHLVDMAETQPTWVVIRPREPVYYVVANPWYALLLDMDGRLSVYCSRTGAELLRPQQISAPLLADLPKPAAPPLTTAVGPTNPVSGEALEPVSSAEPAPRVRMPLVVHRIRTAMFNELDECSVALCSEHGAIFTARLPETPGEPIEMHRLDLHMYGLLDDGAAPAEQPTREVATTVCYRERGDDMLLARGGAHSLVCTTTQSKLVKESERAPTYRCTDAATGWNCVAALGTALVAHGRDGSLHVFSMLDRRKGSHQPDALTRAVGLTPCERGYRSLHVTPTHVHCLLWDGRVLQAM